MYKISIETPITLSKYQVLETKEVSDSEMLNELKALIRKHFGSNVTLDKEDAGYAVRDAGPIKAPNSNFLGFAFYERLY